MKSDKEKLEMKLRAAQKLIPLMKKLKQSELNAEDKLNPAFNMPSDGKSSKDLTLPIYITFLSDNQEVAELELTNLEFIEILASKAEVTNFTGCRITLNDGKQSYTFTLDVDELAPNQSEIRIPMK